MIRWILNLSTVSVPKNLDVLCMYRMLNTFYIDALDLPTLPVSSSLTSAVPESASGPASSKLSAHNTNIGLIRGHPTMNGTFSLRYI